MQQIKNNDTKYNAILAGLWEETQLGNQDAFATIHKKLYPGLFDYARRMLKDEEMVDDLLQDMFIKFWQNSKRIGHIQNVKAYFYRSVRSIVLNHIKSCAVKASRLLNLPEPDLEFSKEEVMMTGEYNRELESKLLIAVNKLPKKQRESVYLRFYENLEYVQIAEITGIKYQSVINHVYRAMQTLKEVAELNQIYVI